jgi:hypothetical protein
LLDYFDAMLYLANWGTKRLAFRLPRSLVDTEAIAPYCIEDMVSIEATKKYVLLDIDFNDEEGGGWIEGEGWLSSLVSIRQDILRGDFRALYLGWLKAISLEPGIEDADYLLEPPVPAGLKKLSPPLKEFVELFEIDEDWIAAASEISPRSENALERNVENLIASLPEQERNDFLARLVRGETNLDAQLAKRLRELSPGGGKSPRRRNVAELFAAASEKARERKEKKRRKAEKARIERLTALSKKEEQVWGEILALIEEKKAKPYDEAIKLLVEMRELGEFLGKADEFQARINQIWEKCSNRPSFLDRMRRARLLE